jgi:hypothetical protein
LPDEWERKAAFSALSATRRFINMSTVRRVEPETLIASYLLVAGEAAFDTAESRGDRTYSKKTQ